LVVPPMSEVIAGSIFEGPKMKFMLFMIPGVYQSGEVAKDFAPPMEMIEKMSRFNEEMHKAGILLNLEGLQPPRNGARVTFAEGKAKVTDEIAAHGSVVGGFWMINVASREEALAWAQRVPAEADDCIEVRPVFEMDETPAR
jgi:hypothetical protein